MINNKNTKNTNDTKAKRRSIVEIFGDMAPHSPSGHERMAYVNAAGVVTYIVG